MQNQAHPTPPTPLATPRLPGVDTGTALRRLRGNVGQYRKFLDALVSQYADTAGVLDGLLRQGDFAAAHLHIHSLKGLAAAIGADALTQAAQALEAALKARDTGNLPALLAQLDDPLTALLCAIALDPTRPAEPPAQRPVDAPASGTPREAATLLPPTVLVVDDQAENIEMLHHILERDYRVKVATHGERALAIALSDQPPDLILLDIMMPGIDGYEVCRRIKARPDRRGIPIIFVTAMEDHEDEALGLALGAEDYITKPFNPSIALARVKTHLALYDQTRELERKVQARTLELQESRLQIIQRLGRAAEFRDNETGFHVTRMSRYSQQIALAAGLSGEEAEMIRLAAPMHDIGKIGTPDAILFKPGRLDTADWIVMQQHAAIGAEIIGDHSDPLLSMARDIAATHHEKWDGSGYPLGLRGEAIPLAGRIVAIADVFDALTSSRPYKQAWPVEKARQAILEDSGYHFDPALIQAFSRALPGILEIRERYLEHNTNTADPD